MADINQFGSVKPVRSGEGMSCAECEAMLSDWMDAAIDGTLSEKDRAAFDLHIATCAECSQMLADAQRGAALLEMLKSSRPEVPPLLFDRIIAQTSGLPVPAKSQATNVLTLPTLDAGALGLRSPVVAPSALAGTAQQLPFGMAGGNVLPFRHQPRSKFSLQATMHTLMQPRLAMTAAMAFFSIALTLNLTGVHLNELRAGDLKPSSLKRSFYQANASVVRYYDNLRVVYELESRVRDLQRSNDNDAPATTGTAAGKAGSSDGSGADKDKPKQEQRKPTPKAGSGTSQRHDPLHNPFQEQFKLAAAHGSGSSTPVTDLAALRRTGFAISTDKSKEELQKGDMV